MNLNRYIIFFIMYTLSSTVYADASCNNYHNQQPELAIKSLVTLLNIKDEDAVDGEVPDEASKNIALLKQGLIDFVNNRLACESTDAIDAKALQQELTTRLIQHIPQEQAAIYGYDLSFFIEKVKHKDSLLIIQIGFGIPCGDDNVLLVYRFRNKQWHLDLQWHSDQYQEISGAFGNGFNYLLLNNDDPTFAIIHGAPWCTSAWGQLSVDVVKLANEAKPQALLFNNVINYYMGNEAGSFKLKPDGFELRLSVQALDTDVLIRKGIYRYHVKDDIVKRVQPIAMHARDFVDEWLTTSKEMALALTDSKHRNELMSTYKKFHERYGFYGAVRKCNVKEALYQVEMNFHGLEKDTDMEPYYFFIQPITNGFIMKSASASASPECTGFDIMSKN